MTDFAKRNTLKKIVVTAGVAAVAPIANASNLLIGSKDNVNSSTSAGKHPDMPQTNLEIFSQLSTQTNELELVLTNTGFSTTTITGMSPSRILDAKGTFDLQVLASNGPLDLPAGGAIKIPLTRSAANRHTALDHSAKSLNIVLKNNVVINTVKSGTSKIAFS